MIVDQRVYRVVTNSDLNEGRGRDVTVGWFYNRDDAVTASVGVGVFGSDAKIEEHEKAVVWIDGDKDRMFLLGEKVIFVYEDPRVVRERALAKLTAKEREVLGLK